LLAHLELVAAVNGGEGYNRVNTNVIEEIAEQVAQQVRHFADMLQGEDNAVNRHFQVISFGGGHFLFLEQDES